MSPADTAVEGFKARTTELAHTDAALERVYAALAAYAAQNGNDTPLEIAMVAAGHALPPTEVVALVENDYYDERALAIRPDVKRLVKAADEAQMKAVWGDSTGEGTAEAAGDHA